MKLIQKFYMGSTNGPPLFERLISVFQHQVVVQCIADVVKLCGDKMGLGLMGRLGRACVGVRVWCMGAWVVLCWGCYNTNPDNLTFSIRMTQPVSFDYKGYFI